MLRHRKSVLTAAALIATTTLLTACQGGGSGGDKANTSSSSSSEAKAMSGSDNKASGSDEEQADGNAGNKSDGKKVTGTWFGTVSYLAPGKYTVSDLKDTKQQFFTSTDTDIQGAGKICGDAAGQTATPCSEDELEAAARDGVSATVKLKNGIAVSVIEDHSSNDDGKTSGLWTGKLAYLAPNKYSVVNDEGQRAFLTSTETVINGAGLICGDREEIKQCTEDELEAAAKKSIDVVVKVDHGIAVTIDENHN
ncbi:MULTISPECIES: hypothetical protein [Streptomyces]|uniref:Lipoprotein n=1 Tax=Streptomyces silvae TaxID=2803812 RepID=A0ABU7ZUB5_9ACTN|nr:MULTISPECIES: hypothetical protein [unclassified Streptomyces]MDX3327374.1 hypothetical protein [Streptomyces sp. ME02-6979-3A]MDX3433566.1 hypothetical protein [Streptomyces sp. ME01-18a]MDX3688555.1 hypothetical protein [Streptomyces sp. AK04-4c]WSS66869.1 hypothetical protein OG491_00435 [Streptomyces sp. NBC_01175]